MPHAPHDIVEFAAGHMTFGRWREYVDAEVRRLTGLECDDLPDWGYADAFEDGTEPELAARLLIAEQPFGPELLADAGIRDHEEWG